MRFVYFTKRIGFMGARHLLKFSSSNKISKILFLYTFLLDIIPMKAIFKPIINILVLFTGEQRKILKKKFKQTNSFEDDTLEDKLECKFRISFFFFLRVVTLNKLQTLKSPDIKKLIPFLGK